MAEEEIELVEYTLQDRNGNTLKGSYNYEGYGLATYPNQDTYEGNFVGGKRNGQGKYFYKQQEDSYEGAWIDNKKHGIGKMIFKEKGSYHGYFENNTRHGQGVFIYQNGDLYSGMWKNGKKHGKGTFIQKATGMKIRGEWLEGQIVRGEWVFPNAQTYTGAFENNRPKGVGVWTFPNGNKCKGEYYQTVVPAQEGDEEIGSGNMTIEVSWKTSREPSS